MEPAASAIREAPWPACAERAWSGRTGDALGAAVAVAAAACRCGVWRSGGRCRVGWVFLRGPADYGDADVEGRVRLASVMDRPGLLRKAWSRCREIVTDDAGDLPWGPQHISETPLYWKLRPGWRLRAACF